MTKTVKCPRCQTPFVARFKGRSRAIRLTPCCGWVGQGKPPPWAHRDGLVVASDTFMQEMRTQWKRLERASK